MLNCILSFAPQLKFDNSRATYLLFLPLILRREFLKVCFWHAVSFWSPLCQLLLLSFRFPCVWYGRAWDSFSSSILNCRSVGFTDTETESRDRETERQREARHLCPSSNALLQKLMNQIQSFSCTCPSSTLSWKWEIGGISLSLSLWPFVLHSFAGAENGNCGSGARGAVEEDDSSGTAARQLHPKEPETRTTSSSGTIVFMAKTARTKATELAETASRYGIRHGHCACGRNLHVRLRFRGFGLVSGLVRTSPRWFRRREWSAGE